MTQAQIVDAARRLHACLATHNRRRFENLKAALLSHPRPERDQVERKLNELLGIRQFPTQT